MDAGKLNGWLVLFFSVLVILIPGESVGQSLHELIVQNHYKYVPAGQGRFPTLIAIPGCSGISSDNPADDESNPRLREDDLLFRRHYRRMAEKLRSEGFAVLLLNIHSAEGVLTACAGEIEDVRIAEYINEAIAWARGLPFVDAENLNLIGWSMGGGGTLAWLHGPRSEATSIRSVTVIYPGCTDLQALDVSVPLLVLLGDADDIAVPTVCDSLIDSSPIRELIMVRHYPGARHGFDIEGAPPLLEIGNDMTIGYQKTASDAAWKELLTFISETP